MGLSLTSLHVFSDTPPKGMEPSFRSFSPGWYTYTGPLDPEREYFFARSLSKVTEGAVLIFSVFDSEQVWFAFFQKGKRIADFSTDCSATPKGTSKIPELIRETGPGSKKRISDILKCADPELLISLLEEFFGVCLLVCEEDTDSPESLRRERSDTLFRPYRKELDGIRGRNAAIRLELVKTLPGKIFIHHWGSDAYCPRNYYYYGFDAPDRFQLTYMEFIGEDLIPCDPVAAVAHSDRLLDIELGKAGVTEEYDPRTGKCTVRFDEKAPEAFRGREIQCPRGYHVFCFDERDHILFTDYSRSLLFADPDGRTVAYLSIKGDPIDCRNGYILTEGSGSEWAYDYSPTDYVRIYRIRYSDRPTGR